MNKIQNGAAAFFILAVTVLTVVSVFGIWEVFDKDVIEKSFQTLGLVAVVSIVVMAAGKFIGNHDTLTNSSLPAAPNPLFKSIRKITLAILIISATLLALLGVLAIWDVITDSNVLEKSLSSLAIVGFSSLIIVATCLDREGNPLMRRNANASVGTIIVLIIVAYLILQLLMW